jgi:hypothetical protein
VEGAERRPLLDDDTDDEGVMRQEMIPTTGYRCRTDDEGVMG